MISAFILATNGSSGGDEDHDRSLLFAFTPNATTKSSTNTLKGLGLAVRGALESICGEKTRVLRLRQQQYGDISAVFSHLQVGMVVLTLPGQLADAVACSLALQLAQSMVLLAGPSSTWTEQHHEPGGATYAKIKKPLQSLFERLCEGMLRQVSGPGWMRGLPACVLQQGIMCLQLSFEKQLEMDTMLRAHEAGGLLGLVPPPASQGLQMQYNFYSRSCCLMYRGLTVWSGLTPGDTRLTWQLCWALGAHGQAQSLPCQVTMHRVHLTVPRVDAAAVDAHPGSSSSQQAQALGQSHPYSLLILVSACHMVLAVLLTAYDEDIEELAGQVEAHAAVELLAKLHNSFIQDLGQATGSSLLLTSISRAPPDAAAAATAAALSGSFSSPRGPGAGGARPKTPGHHNSLFMRIISRSRPSTSGAPPRPRLVDGAPPSPDSSSHLRPLSPAHTSPHSLPPPSPTDTASTTSPPSLAHLPTTSPNRSPAVRARTPFAPGTSPIAEINTPPTSADTPRAPGAASPASPTVCIYQRNTSLPGRLEGNSSLGSYLDAAPNAAATHAVIHYDVETGRIVTQGDIPHISMVPDIWDTILVCRTMFDNGSVAVSAPPKHSRLCMTIQQIEQLSATRSQREGGQRLGSADATPWQYHPEVAGLATIQQVTRKLESSKNLVAQSWFVTAVKHVEGHETFIVHSDEVDEAAVLHELIGYKLQHHTRPNSALGVSSQPQLQLHLPALPSAAQPARPGVIKNLAFG